MVSERVEENERKRKEGRSGVGVRGEALTLIFQSFGISHGVNSIDIIKMGGGETERAKEKEKKRRRNETKNERQEKERVFARSLSFLSFSFFFFFPLFHLRFVVLPSCVAS